METKTVENQQLKYPIRVTEISCTGSKQVWILKDSKHLAECIADDPGYEEFLCGYYDEESWPADDQSWPAKAYSVEVYLDSLRRNAQSVRAEEVLSEDE